MNAERGVSSLAMVLMLLVLGSLMLQGLNQAQRQRLAMVNDESLAIQRTAQAHSALQWGIHQPWGTEAGAQCMTYAADTRVCLRLLTDGRLLLIAQSDGFSLWQSGRWAAGNLQFSAHGWSDFCPLKEALLCQIP